MMGGMQQERAPNPKWVAAGGRLKALRQMLGLKQDEVAGLTGGAVDRCELSKYENGRHRVRDDQKRLGLARALGLSLDDLHDLMHGGISVDAAFRRSKRAAKAAS
jgi:transcriptional regulator with XRE-family HTH domain